MNERLSPPRQKSANTPDVIVVGAGIGGLTAAVWLAFSGFRVRVLEAATELREVGAGVTLGPNATRVLRAGGVWEEVSSRASRPALQVLQSWDGRVLLTAEPNDADSDPAGYLQVHRADLQQALAGALDRLIPGALRLGHPVATVEADVSRPKVVLENGSTLTADLVVGADGVRSAVRRALFSDEAPEFAGFVAYRGLVPYDRLPKLESPAPSGFTMGPGKSFVRYMIRGGEILNFAAFVATPHWEQEGWSVACERSELEPHFAEAHEDVRKTLAAAPGTMLHKWGLFLRPPLEHWTRGRVTLLGDAAHPMLPFLGQGASMALEDGCILARAIAEMPTLDAALEAYERLRLPRANAIAAASSARAKAIHSGTPEAYRRQVDADDVSSRANLFEYDATQIDLGTH